MNCTYSVRDRLYNTDEQCTECPHCNQRRIHPSRWVSSQHVGSAVVNGSEVAIQSLCTLAIAMVCYGAISLNKTMRTRRSLQTFADIYSRLVKVTFAFFGNAALFSFYYRCANVVYLLEFLVSLLLILSSLFSLKSFLF